MRRPDTHTHIADDNQTLKPMSHVNACARQHCLSSNALVYKLTGETAHQASGTLEAERTSQPGTLIKRPTRPAVWQLIKLGQSPPALRKALQHLPLPTVQEALASMGDVGDLIGGGSPPRNASKH